ncbi:MAG: DUF1570 domain-containing protein [Planctomycetes bacterium]|nr:DUF1570 domain-containing protein [Planctomycetota bacterium]
MILWLMLLLQEETKTPHYDLRVEKIDAADAGRMLEELHAQLTKHFGSAPAERLKVEVYGTRDGWSAALRRDKQPIPEGAGGYYSPGTKKAYLYVQPTEYFTRQLLLHEATHQFHYLAATGNRDPAAPWYTEGLAEYFGMHNWDGRTLRTGVVPAVTLEDYPEKAAQNLGRIGWNLGGMIEGKLPADRPEAWALIHYLIHNHPKPFAALSKSLDCGAKGRDAWKSVFGNADVAEPLRAWLEKNAQPWRIVWIGWQERGDVIEGAAGTNGAAVLKRSGPSLKAELELRSGELKAGLIFGYRSPDDFAIAQFVGSARVRIVRRSGGGWRILAEKEVPPRERPELHLAHADGRVRVTANGEEIGEFEATGDFGLNVDACRVAFRIR